MWWTVRSGHPQVPQCGGQVAGELTGGGGGVVTGGGGRVVTGGGHQAGTVAVKVGAPSATALRGLHKRIGMAGRCAARVGCRSYRRDRGTTSNLLPSKYLAPPGVTGPALRARAWRAAVPRTRLADNGIRQGYISGYLFYIGRRACPQGEGTSADGEPLSSAPVCGKESRGLGGDARDLGRLGGGHGGRGRYGSRCLNNSCNACGLARNRHVATHQDGRHASGLGYHSTWDSNGPDTQGDRQDHFGTSRPRISSGSHSPGDRPPAANADGYIRRNG